MRKAIFVAVLCVFVALPALADPTFYVAPNSYPASSSSLDEAWQAAVGSFIEMDLDNFANGAHIDTLTFGSIVANVGAGNAASTAKIFAGSWGGSDNGSVYGTVYGNGLLNQDAAGAIHGEIVFEFSEPVAGFGAWLYDNNIASGESFVMTVTEVGGTQWTSAVLESGNETAHFVEGWLAATSLTGITSVSYQVLDASGAPVSGKYFEMDHLQLSPVPVPGAMLLGLLGLGAAGVKLRKRV